MSARFQSGDQVVAGGTSDTVGVVRGVYRREIKTLEGIQEAFSYRVEWPDGEGEPIDEDALEPAP